MVMNLEFNIAKPLMELKKKVLLKLTKMKDHTNYKLRIEKSILDENKNIRSIITSILINSDLSEDLLDVDEDNLMLD